jgi:hypothetical protein
LKTPLNLLCFTAIILSTQPFGRAASLLVSYSSINGGGIEKYSLTPQTTGTIFDQETVAVNSLTVANNTAYWASGGTQIYSDSLNDATGGAAKTALPSLPFGGVTISDLAVDPATNQYLVGWIAPGYGWFIVQYPLSPPGDFSIFVNATTTIQGLTIAGNKAYWIEGINVWSQNLDGTGKSQVQNFSFGGVELNDLAVDSASQTYFLAAATNGLPPLIARYPLTPNANGNLFTFATNNIPAVTLAGDRAYWIDGQGVYSKRLDGTDFTLQETLPNGLTPTDLAVSLDAPVSAPEPATSTALGGGLILFAMLLRNRRLRKAER